VVVHHGSALTPAAAIGQPEDVAIKVLVVDPDPESRELAAAQVRFWRPDAFVCGAEDAFDAERTLALAPFDAIVADLMAPRLYGLELARAFGRIIPVFLMTDFQIPGLEAEARRAGCSGLFYKFELTRAIERAMMWLR
jgi:CheY-like chemotaxis protein